jgi:phosphatidate cytidylyltransferase
MRLTFITLFLVFISPEPPWYYSPMKNEIKPPPRVTTGLLIGAGVVLLAYLGGWFWAGMNLAFFAVASQELFAIIRTKHIYPSRLTVLVFGLLFYLFASLGLERHFDVLVTVGVVFTFVWLLFRKIPASISDIGATILAFFYLGFLPAHFVVLRNMASPSQPELGLYYLFWVILVVSSCDIFAYYGGRGFGKNLLSPQISPKKTIEGALTGTFAACLVSTGLAHLLNIGWHHGVALGILLSGIAQVGDLSESLFKRDAGLKDSGSLFPGHGGLLDRTDSYIFSGVLAYYYISWFIHHQGIAKEVLQLLAR